MYIIPYLVVNNWLVMITLLQHTHPKLPHYNDKEWDWLRGALATVDRSYGILDYFFHHIADTHVAHHLFSTMPHYHAEEVQKQIFYGTPMTPNVAFESSEMMIITDSQSRLQAIPNCASRS